VNDGSWENVSPTQDNKRHVLKLVLTVQSGVLNSAFSFQSLTAHKKKAAGILKYCARTQTPPVLLTVTVDR
jgi:hypothetical protein